MKRKTRKIEKEVLFDAIHEIAGLTPEEMQTFVSLCGFKEKEVSTGYNPSYFTWYLMVDMGVLEFFKALAEFKKLKRKLT